MPSLNKRPGAEAFLSILIFLILLAYFIAFGIINFAGFETFCTTDMYEDTLVARLMWEQKTLFPKNFLFGNQFYIIATPVLSALFYGITGSMNTSMALATTVMSLLILISLYWMISPFVKAKHLRLAVLLAMVSGVFGPQTVIREDGQLFFVMCSFYACYLITFFCLMGDYVRARRDESLRPVALALMLFLSFCTGMQSLRQTCVSMLPILCFECLSAFQRLVKKQPLWEKGHRMSLIRAASYLIANVCGLVFIKLLGVGRNEIYYGKSIFSGASVGDKLRDLHEALITVSGFDFTREGGKAFFTVIFLFYFLASVYALFMLIRKKDFNTAPAIFWWLSAIAIAAVIAASFVTSVKLRDIYLFPFYALPALSFIVLCHYTKPKLQNILCLCFAAMAALNLYYSYGDNAKLAVDAPETPFTQAADYALENGFEYVYGSHSNTSPKIAAQTDGKIIAGCWEDDVIFKVSTYINIKDVYYFFTPQNALYVFLENELPHALSEAEGNGTKLQFHKQFGNLYLYTASRQMMYPISEHIYNAERYPEYN